MGQDLVRLRGAGGGEERWFLRGWDMGRGLRMLRRYAIEHGSAKVVIGQRWDVEWVLLAVV